MNLGMSYEKLIKRYHLEQGDILAITEGVLHDKSLAELQSDMNGRLTKEKIYVIARAVCKDLIGEDIAVVAPVMTKERRSLSQENNSKTHDQKPNKNDYASDSSAQSAEEVMLLLSELFYESEG